MNIVTTGKPEFNFNPALLEDWRLIQDNYKHHIRDFIDYAVQHSSSSGIELIREYYLQLNESGLSASTIQCRRAALKNRLRSSVQGDAEKAALNLILERLDRSQETKAPGRSRRAVSSDRVIKPQEYEKLMQQSRSARQRRFIEFLYRTGCRVSEMTGVLLSDCSVSGNVVKIRIRGKGNARQKYKEREVFISVPMFERIRETFSGDTYLFETSMNHRYNRSYVSNQLGKLTLYILGRRIAAHGFRHSFATRMIKDTGRVSAVSGYLGHSDILLTLQLYTHDSLSAADVLGPEAVAL